MMKVCGALMAAVTLVAACAPSAVLAQDKPTLSGYLQQGYDIIHIEGAGGQFIFFHSQERTHAGALLRAAPERRDLQLPADQMKTSRI